MKKISIILTFFLCLLSVQSVFAETSSIQVAEGYYDAINDALVICGVLPDEISNVPMTLKVVYDGKVTGAAETIAMEKDGSVCFEFPPVYFRNTAPSGEYTISVGTLYDETVFTDTLNYCGADRMYIAVQQAQNVKNGTTTFDDVFENYNDALQIDYATYTGLKKTKSVFAGLMNAKTYNLPSGAETEEDCNKIKKVVKKFRDDVSEILSICKFMEIQTADEMKVWLNQYGKGYSLESDNVTTKTVDESLIYNDYFKPVMNDERFLSRIEEIEMPSDRESLKSLIYEMALLTNIEVKTSVVIKNIFENFGDLFPVTQGKKNEAYAKLATNRYLTYEEAAKAYDMAAKPSSSSGASSGRGGNDSSWGSASSGKTQYMSGEILGKAEPFEDLGNVQWAKEAILTLYEKKIVSGDGFGKFYPQNNVTRSEFLKMILLSCGIAVDQELTSSFKDVSPSSWYAPYVATAKNLGIIQGTEDERFMPEDNITRQDMVVMLYRAQQHKNSGNFTFADNDEIADYATDAVSYYAEKGIVSGMGKNRFEPKQLSTRAQAAQLIYNVIR